MHKLTHAQRFDWSLATLYKAARSNFVAVAVKMQSNAVFSVSENKKMKLTRSKDGTHGIDLRIYENDRPTAKGVTLNILQFQNLIDLLPVLESGLDDLTRGSEVNVSENLSGDVFVTVESPFFCVNVRQYFIPNGGYALVPTRRGITFNAREFLDFKTQLKSIADRLSSC
jgi:hypothetical protein